MHHLKKSLERLVESRLNAYAASPSDLLEHYGIEQTVLAGGYGYRQILELVQNGADAILEAADPTASQRETSGRIEVRLTDRHLYVANTGAPVSVEGLEALLNSHRSSKRGNQIGRFGLGFKSLLKLGGRIDICLGEGVGSIRFEPERCRADLVQRFGAERVPGLRLAYWISTGDLGQDKVLRELSWATTVVRVELLEGADTERLAKEIAQFPSEFLVFLPVPVELRLVTDAATDRTIRIRSADGAVELQEAQKSTRWKLFSADVEVDDAAALSDATEIHSRGSVPVSWAMPLDRVATDAGRFWAFFPTNTATFIPGILNAPWKLNSDRASVIPGPWNAYLMRSAGRLVAESLASLSTEDDPGRVLDAFPRQLDRKDQVAAPLIEEVWQQIAKLPLVPNANGVLCRGEDLWQYPISRREVIDAWITLAVDPVKDLLVHPSCVTDRRIPRLEAFREVLEDYEGEGPALASFDPTAWLESVAPAAAASQKAFLRLIEKFSRTETAHAWQFGTVRKEGRFVPVANGYAKADEALLLPEGSAPPGRFAVAEWVLTDPEARQIVEQVLRVQSLGNDFWERELTAALQSAANASVDTASSPIKWEQFWAVLRSAPSEVAKPFARLHGQQIKVCRGDGAWVPRYEVLVPGLIVAAREASEHPELLADPRIHGASADLLCEIGVSDWPAQDYLISKYRNNPTLRSMLTDWVHHWRNEHARNIKPCGEWGYHEPLDGRLPCGVLLLPLATGKPRNRIVASLVNTLNTSTFSATVPFGHRSVKSYPRSEAQHPLPWLLMRHASINKADYSAPLRALVQAVKEWQVLGTTQAQSIAAASTILCDAEPVVAVNDDDLRQAWSVITEDVQADDLHRDDLVTFWNSASHVFDVAPKILALAERNRLGRVVSATSVRMAELAREIGLTALTVDTPTAAIWQESGIAAVEGLLVVDGPSAGPERLLVEYLPELAQILPDELCQRLTAAPRKRLKIRVEDRTATVQLVSRDSTLYWDASYWDEASNRKRLEAVITELIAAGQIEGTTEELLERLQDSRGGERQVAIAQQPDLAHRLWVAVGERRQPLLEALGHPAQDRQVAKLKGPELAGLTLSMLGPITLQKLAGTLADEGLSVPGRWGTAEARAFVESLGFPREFSETSSAKREAEEIVSGPIPLGDLHSYQADVLDRIGELAATETTRRRAVVSLPTGAGKTRVAVEAAIRHFLVSSEDVPLVLWLANTDELCEQAVQAFRQIWINRGRERADLRVIRLWGDNRNPQVSRDGQPTVVVASIQTLSIRTGQPDLEWMRKPGLVIVDECHHAITPSYTRVLQWLDAGGAARTGGPKEPVVLGLSATPFRTSDDESKALASRFGRRMFPEAQEDLYARLLADGILSRTVLERLETDTAVDLETLSSLLDRGVGEDDLAFQRAVERMNELLGEDEDRNEKLVEFLVEAESSSILFFANSVAHAELVAARLNLHGVPAAAVSGNTAPSARRYFVRRFRDRAIRVLCNHSVLTTGFDAPSTEMIVVARQVFSPSRYMQMVGRGLRGPKNGGTESCTIVSVVDNLGRFAERHPYHYCERYFNELTENDGESIASLARR